MERPLLRTYLFTLLFVALAWAARAALRPVLHDHSPLLTFTVAVAAGAHIGGLGAGLLATVASAGIAWSTLAHGSADPWAALLNAHEVVRLGVFLVGGAVTSWVCHRLHAARAAAEADARLLRQSEERFRLLMDVVNDAAVFMLDDRGRVASWNAGAQQTCGYRFDEIVGQPLSRFYTDEDVATGLPERHLACAAAEGRFEADHAVRQRKGGATFPASVILTALHAPAAVQTDAGARPAGARADASGGGGDNCAADADAQRVRGPRGEPRGYVLVMRDLTWGCQVESELRAKEAAETDSRMKDELIAMIEQELRPATTAASHAGGSRDATAVVLCG